MSFATRITVKWLLLFMLLMFVVACAGKQQPTGQDSSVTTNQRPPTSPSKAIESPGAQVLAVAREMLGIHLPLRRNGPKGLRLQRPGRLRIQPERGELPCTSRPKGSAMPEWTIFIGRNA